MENMAHTLINQLDKKAYRWFAVCTKYKAEKYVLENLKKKGIQAYVPLIAKTKKYNSKIKHTLLPLINCYVFVKIIQPEYIKVLETEYVIRFLKQKQDLIAIPDCEIEIMRRVVGEAVLAIPNEEIYELGTPVEVVRGNLTGLKGTVVDIKGKKEFLVSVESIAYQMVLGISPDYLRPV